MNTTFPSSSMPIFAVSPLSFHEPLEKWSDDDADLAIAQEGIADLEGTQADGPWARVTVVDHHAVG
ncbi:hypothetical protein J2W42_006360 [Rhizobium tibeticum]|nr:hypothetical protein [Rhizobium tibeticum]